MFNWISGVPNWETKETRGQVIEARKDYDRSIDRLKDKKEEYRSIKKRNEKER